MKTTKCIVTAEYLHRTKSSSYVPPLPLLFRIIMSLKGNSFEIHYDWPYKIHCRFGVRTNSPRISDTQFNIEENCALSPVLQTLRAYSERTAEFYGRSRIPWKTLKNPWERNAYGFVGTVANKLDTPETVIPREIASLSPIVVSLWIAIPLETLTRLMDLHH